MAIERRHVNVTQYDSMDFGDYEFREFPMAVPVVGGVIQKTPYDANRKAHPVVIVNSQAEYDALKGGEAEVVPEDYDGAVSRVKTEDDEIEALLIEASQAGVKLDRRWSPERMRKTLDDAKKDPVL